MRPRFSYNIVEKKNNEGVADMKKLKALLINGSPESKGLYLHGIDRTKKHIGARRYGG